MRLDLDHRTGLAVASIDADRIELRRPTLIEWDSALPDIGVLLDEAAKADAVARAALKDMQHAAAV